MKPRLYVDLGAIWRDRRHFGEVLGAIDKSH
jgi:hypothetical protein